MRIMVMLGILLSSLLINNAFAGATTVANSSTKELMTQLTQGIGRVHDGFYYSWQAGSIYKEINKQQTKTRSAQALAPITYIVSPKVSFVVCLQEFKVPTLCDSTKNALDILIPVLSAVHKQQQYQFQLVVKKSDPTLTKRFVEAVKLYFDHKRAKGAKMDENLVSFEEDFAPELYEMFADIEKTHQSEITASAALMTVAAD